MKITTIYDNNKCRDDLYTGWGFSCLIEIDGKRIMFDTGEDPVATLANMEKLGIDVKDIDIIVISHEHHDHTGALSKITSKNPSVEVYMPDRFTGPEKITGRVHTTGPLGSSPIEQSLMIDSGKGLVIITGCAHPGIVKIVRTAKSYMDKDVPLIIGGLHLKSAGEQEIKDVIRKLKETGVKKTAPSHCTGEEAIRLFKAEFGPDFIKNGAGNIIRI